LLLQAEVELLVEAKAEVVTPEAAAEEQTQKQR
jgi:hypothetical protein